MATLTEVAEWVAGIYQIEETDPVLGGPPNEATKAGLDNIPHLHLAKRTAWLRQMLLNAGISGESSRLVTSFDAIVTPGFFYGNSGATGSPDGATTIMCVHVAGASPSDAYQVAMRRGSADRMWMRRKFNGAWAAWVEMLHTGNIGTAGMATLQTSPTDRTAGRVLTVGAFGLGGNAPTYTGSLDNVPATGFYLINDDTVTNGPPVPAPYDSILLHIQGNTQKNQLFFGNGGVIYSRMDEVDSLGWRPWVELTISGRTITAGLGLAGGGNLSADRTLSLALGELPAVDAASFAAPRFPVIDGVDSATQGRSTATQMRNALAVYSQGEVDALVTSAALAPKIAALSLGGVGTYAFLRRSAGNAAISKGDTYAGSSLRYAGVIDSDGDYKAQLELADNTAPSGTWRAMGSVGAISTQYSATLFLRIS